MKTMYNPASSTPYLRSMASCLNRVVDDGYVEDFRATRNGLLSSSTHKLYQSDQVRLINFFRFEGFANTNENAILYVIETSDGIKGTLIDASGIKASPLINKFILDVKTKEKKK